MDRQIIYVKTPKTAGTSIRAMLIERIGAAPYEEIYAETWKYPSRKALEKARLIILGEMVAKKFKRRFPKLWANARSFAVVRHPYDKTISAWKYCKSTRDKELDRILSCDMPRHKFWTRDNHDYIHFTISQSKSLVSRGCVIVDRIFKFEKITKSPDNLFEFLRLPSQDLLHRNPSTHREIRDPYQLPRATLDLIYQNYTEDFINFRYEK